MYSPVKHLLWHPSDSSRLLVQTSLEEPTIYLYTTSDALPSSSNSSSTSQAAPAILTLASHISKPSPLSGPTKYTVSWLDTPADKKPALLFAHAQSSILVWPQGKDQILRFEHEDQEESDDSLFEILTGKTARFADMRSEERGSGGGEKMDIDVDEDGVERDGGYRGYAEEDSVDEVNRGYGDSVDTIGGGGLDDTFREKHVRYDVRGESEREQEERYETSGLGESGLSEMF
jgi:hypothetical protein